ncbi:hypothetical protein AFLA_003932 [Aspergillus flavus NRRL3357]|nr:hypothetical protein AFLA_003932 [Aspergillus flavus NRRL3357]
MKQNSKPRALKEDFQIREKNPSGAAVRVHGRGRPRLRISDQLILPAYWLGRIRLTLDLHQSRSVHALESV